MDTKTIPILVAFIIYMLAMIIIGFATSNNKSNEDYFLGGRGLGSWTAALSAQASDMSGWLLMGLPGAIYIAGTGEVWIGIGLFIGTFLNWWLVARRLRKYTLVANNSLTIPSFFQNRFKDQRGIIKIVSAIVIIVFFSVYTASAFASGAKLFSTVFGDGPLTQDGTATKAYLIGLAVAVVVILVYTFMGGFKAVCYTDFVQGLLMIVAILSVPIIAYISITKDGGTLAKALENNGGVADAASYLSLFKNADGTPISIVSIISNLGWALGYFGMPHILVRFMAIKSDKEVKKSRVIAIIWLIISLGAACLLGLIARGFLIENLADSGTQELVFIKSILQIFDGNWALIFIGGVFLCGIMAAIMSTADSQLLVASSAVSEDVYKGTIKKDASEKSSLLVGRIAVIVVAAIAFVIALNPNSSIMDLVSDAWAGFGASFGPIVLLSLFWKRFNLAGAASGMITGFLTVIVWDYIPLVNGGTIYAATGLYSLVVGFVLAIIVAVVITLCTKKPSQEIQDEFDKVKTIEI